MARSEGGDSYGKLEGEEEVNCDIWVEGRGAYIENKASREP